MWVGTSLVVQWLRFHTPNAGAPGSIPGQGTRSRMPRQNKTKPSGFYSWNARMVQYWDVFNIIHHIHRSKEKNHTIIPRNAKAI